MNALTIADTAIRQDAEGRYCLNDLHRASGGEKRHQPSDWLRIQQTQALIAEIQAVPGIPGTQQNQPLNVLQGGSLQGTYVCKELVYAYAMWISPAFHLKVIRAYDALVAQPAALIPALPDFSNPAAAARAWAEQFEQREQLALENQTKAEALAIAAPKAQALDRIAADDKALTVTQAAKVLGVKREALTHWLHANGWTYRQNGSWVAYQQHIQNGRLQFKEAKYTDENTGQEVHRPYCHITPKGLAKLAEVFRREVAHG
jgi:phage antirepressor YoqD-like protein